MGEESGGKQISQTLDIVREFRKFGRSFTGLLLLEIGWTLILVLATKLTGETTSPPEIRGISLATGWIVGSAVIFLAWSVYSRLYLYLLWPIVIVLKPIFDIIYVIFALILAIFNGLLLPIIILTRHVLVFLWIRRYRRDFIAVRKAKNPSHSDEKLESEYAAFVKEMEAKQGKGSLKKVASGEVWLKKDIIIELAWPVGELLLSPIHSSIRVGLAPLMPHWNGDSWETPTPQPFKQDIANVISHVKDLARNFHFSSLPSLVQIQTHRGARLTKVFFSLDTLAWGNYCDLQYLTARVYFDALRSDQANGIPDTGLKAQRDLFPGRFESNLLREVNSIDFSTRNSIECYILILILSLKAITRRNAQRFTRWKRAWDRSFREADQTIDSILAHIAIDLLPLLPHDQVVCTLTPTIYDILPDIAGKWVGHQLSEDRPYGERDRWTDTFGKTLGATLEICRKMQPGNADHLYRFGVLYCRENNVSEALRVFRQAMSVDVEAGHQVSGIAAGILAQEALLFERYSVFAAHAARAIALNGSELVEEAMKKSSDINMYRILASANSDTEIPAYLKIVDGLLAEKGEVKERTDR